MDSTMNNSTTIEFKIQRLNILAFPRDLNPVCEISGEKAQVELITPFITLFYMSEELAEQAWQGIIKKIAHLLGPLMKPAPIVGTQEERNRRINNMNISKKSLVEFCMTECSNLLSIQKYKLAFPAAYQALKFCKEVDGEKSVSTVEPYLLLSQSSLGLNQFNKAEEYLSLARWIVLNTPNCSDKSRSKLHMLKGRVASAQGNFDVAKVDFADGIYYCSRYFGAESIACAVGYYRLADVFLSTGNVECSLAFFDKVVDIWYKYLSELPLKQVKYSSIFEGELDPQAAIEARAKAESDEEAEAKIAEQLTEENTAEGRSQLEIIFEHRKRLLGNNHIATGEVQYTLGLFEFFLLGSKQQDLTGQQAVQSNVVLAYHFVNAALDAYMMQLGAEHPSTRHVSAMLHLIKAEGRMLVEEGGSATMSADGSSVPSTNQE